MQLKMNNTNYINYITRRVNYFKSFNTKVADYFSYSPAIYKEKEIIVWMRIYPEQNKDIIINESINKFSINRLYAEELYTKAFPEDFINKNKKVLNNINTILNESDIGVEYIDDIILSLNFDNPLKHFEKNTQLKGNPYIYMLLPLFKKLELH